MNAKNNRIAVIGNSPFFPRTTSSSEFWKKLVSHEGLIAAIMSKQWPFNEFMTGDAIKGLKDFFMKSGMSPENIDVPEEIFPVAAARNALRLFLARQAADSCAALSSKKVSAEKIGAFFAETDNVESFPDISQLLAAHLNCRLIKTDQTLKNSYEWLRLAAGELAAGASDIIAVVEPESACSISSFFNLTNDSIAINEGMCAICLRNFDQAIKDGDNILAVLSIDEGGLISVEKISATESDKNETDPEAKLKKLAEFSRYSKEKLVLSPDGKCLNLPFNNPEEAAIKGSDSGNLNWKKFREKLAGKSNERRFLHDLLGALAGTFISRISFESPLEFIKIADRPVIYAANHQIGLESPMFMTLAYAATGLPVQAVAKPDHIDAWLSFLMDFAQDSLEPPNPFSLIYFDRNNPQGLIDELKNNEVKSSLLVHVDGTRSKSADVPAAKISSVFIDLAVNKDIPVVPVRFVGGLPVEPVEKPLDFPFMNGKQDYLIGAPILPAELAKLPYGQRPKMILERINNLGPKAGEDLPLAPDKEFISRTAFFKDSFKLPTIQAMLFAILQSIDDPCEETAFLIKAVQSGKLSSSAAEPGFPPVLKKFLVHLKTKFS